MSTKELVEHAEEEVLRTKEAYDKAVSKLKEAREKQDKEKQKEMLNAIAKSKWSYDADHGICAKRSGRFWRRINKKYPTHLNSKQGNE